MGNYGLGYYGFFSTFFFFFFFFGSSDDDASEYAFFFFLRLDGFFFGEFVVSVSSSSKELTFLGSGFYACKLGSVVVVVVYCSSSTNILNEKSKLTFFKSFVNVNQ